MYSNFHLDDLHLPLFLSAMLLLSRHTHLPRLTRGDDGRQLTIQPPLIAFDNNQLVIATLKNERERFLGRGAHQG